MIINASVKSTIIEVIVNIGEAIGDFLKWVINKLPNDPFNLSDVLTVPQPVQDVLGFVNWLIPIGRCLQLVLIWFTVITTIWFIRFILKATHVI